MTTPHHWNPEGITPRPLEHADGTGGEYESGTGYDEASALALESSAATEMASGGESPSHAPQHQDLPGGSSPLVTHDQAQEFSGSTNDSAPRTDLAGLPRRRSELNKDTPRASPKSVVSGSAVNKSASRQNGRRRSGLSKRQKKLLRTLFECGKKDQGSSPSTPEHDENHMLGTVPLAIPSSVCTENEAQRGQIPAAIPSSTGTHAREENEAGFGVRCLLEESYRGLFASDATNRDGNLAEDEASTLSLRHPWGQNRAPSPATLPTSPSPPVLEEPRDEAAFMMDQLMDIAGNVQLLLDARTSTHVNASTWPWPSPSLLPSPPLLLSPSLLPSPSSPPPPRPVRPSGPGRERIFLGFPKIPKEDVGPRLVRRIDPTRLRHGPTPLREAVSAAEMWELGTNG